MKDEASSYAKMGVDYGALDGFKRLCQQLGKTTKGVLSGGLQEPEAIRGESAYLLESEDAFYAHVEEGLGTKNLVADDAKDLFPNPYHAIGIDTVASIVNDLITVGALPVMLAMHAAVGDGQWFADEARARDLAEGFAEGCRQSGAVWGGGETPALKGIIDPKAIVLAGSAFGIIKPKSQRITGKVKAGDRIVILASSGIHANGITMCRKIAEQLPNGYAEKIEDGKTFGAALLTPTFIYAKFIRECFNAGVVPNYAVNVTGHGWRKFMRLDGDFIYRFDALPPAQPVFTFLMKAAKIDLREAYATFNMGAGFAVYVSPADEAKVLATAKKSGYTAVSAGEILDGHGKKAVQIPQHGIEFDGSSLHIRG